ncbi:hypothetical protein TrVE_jg13729 [Triparma verrucosa]|uniref:Uncharacterized protein n=1 Tax=Triparma verrucosa TaxID=1606542 RepID=A0A9W7C5M4_9STRA|nr:hypothetical protein TrVE_jg13729 [Triparma verrucosa]
MSTKGRKRNPKLDRAVEAVLAGGVGQVPLRNALLAGGFSEIESSTKSVRDQLSRRLRNLRKEKEAQSLAAGGPSSPEKGGSSSSAFPARNSVDYLVQHARKFLEHHRPVAAILDSNEREAFIDRFRELMERESHAYSLTSSFGRGTFSTVNHQPIPTFTSTSTSTSTSASTSAPTSMGQYQPPHSQFSSNHDSNNNTPTLTSTSVSASSTPVTTSKFTTLATSIPVVGGVPQTWVAHHNHMHSMNCTHEAKRHRPNDGSAPHLDFLIRDGDRTFVECYGGVNHTPTAAITSLPSTLCSHGVEATACSKTPGTPKSVGWVNPNLPTIMNLEDVNLDEFDDWDEEDWKLLQS